MTPSNSVLDVLDLHMRRGRFLLIVLIELFMNSCRNLVGLLFVLEHCLR